MVAEPVVEECGALLGPERPRAVELDHPSVRGIEHELRDLVRRLARDD
jgi:hypothetical protein